jgi:hypothetical protein
MRLLVLLLIALLLPEQVDAAKKVKRKHRKNRPAENPAMEGAGGSAQPAAGVETMAAEDEEKEKKKRRRKWSSDAKAAAAAAGKGAGDEDFDGSDGSDGGEGEDEDEAAQKPTKRYGLGMCRKPDEDRYCGYWGDYQVDLLYLLQMGLPVALLLAVYEFLYPEKGEAHRSERSKRFHATWRRRRNGGFVNATKELAGIEAKDAAPSMSVEEARAALAAKQQRALSSKPMDERARASKRAATARGAKDAYKSEKSAAKGGTVFDPLKGLNPAEKQD